MQKAPDNTSGDSGVGKSAQQHSRGTVGWVKVTGSRGPWASLKVTHPRPVWEPDDKTERP